MHVFLLFCVGIEFLAIIVLALKQRRTSHWIDDVLDLEEGSGMLRSQLESLASTVKDFSDQRDNDARDISQRITDLADKIESMRRKSSARQGGGGFEAIRNRAESVSAQSQQIPRKELLSLAEGQ